MKLLIKCSAVISTLPRPPRAFSQHLLLKVSLSNYRFKIYIHDSSPSTDSISIFFSNPNFFFFYLGFLSRTFMIHGTAGEGGGYLFNSSLPLPSLHRHLDISWAITAESSPLHIVSSRTRTGNLWFPSARR